MSCSTDLFEARFCAFIHDFSTAEVRFVLVWLDGFPRVWNIWRAPASTYSYKLITFLLLAAKPELLVAMQLYITFLHSFLLSHSPFCGILRDSVATEHILHFNHLYTPQKMFLLPFSFANFETTRGNTRKANMIKVYYTVQKKLLLNFQNLQMKKQGETFLGSVHPLKSYQQSHTI